MRTKWNINTVRDYYYKNGYELLDEKYINNRIPMKIRTKEGYITFIRLSDLQKGNIPICFGKNNKYTLQNIQQFINNHKSKTILLSPEFKGNTQNLEFKCECGNIFERTWGNMQKFKTFNCPQCILKKRVSKRKKKFCDVVKLFNSNGLTLLSNEESYSNNSTKLKAITKEGYKVSISYNNLLKGKTPTILGLKNNRENFDYNIKLWFELNHVECEYIGIIDENSKIIACRCSCGNIFQDIYIRIANKHKTKCNECTQKQSKYAQLTEEWLRQNNLKYIKEKRYLECKDKRTLPFDFYLPDFNILIEVDGEQHYRENALYYTPNIKSHEKIKNDFCSFNGIKLIRIPYWTYFSNNFESILSSNILQE